MIDHAFVVSKPLQLLIAISIIEQLDISYNSLIIIIDSFAGSHRIANNIPRLKGKMSGISSFLVKSHKDAYRILRRRRFKNIFIDSDVGIQRYLQLIRIRVSSRSSLINVYEEGIGTYRSDLYSGLKKSILKIFGAGTHFGGCTLTQSLYLYDSARYKRLFCNDKIKLINIYPSIKEFLIANFRTFSDLFCYKEIYKTGESCSLYLSNWYVDENFLLNLKKLPMDIYVKLHPHIKEQLNIAAVSLLDPSFPAEMVIANLAESYELVDVYHHGSSVENYMPLDNVKYIRI